MELDGKVFDMWCFRSGNGIRDVGWVRVCNGFEEGLKSWLGFWLRGCLGDGSEYCDCSTGLNG